MTNIKIYKRHFYISDFRQDMTFAHESITQTHTGTNKPLGMLIHGILQIFLLINFHLSVANKLNYYTICYTEKTKNEKNIYK